MIGFYDSGFGGFTVLRRLRRQLPGRDFVYLASEHAAYVSGAVLRVDGDTIRSV